MPRPMFMSGKESLGSSLEPFSHIKESESVTLSFTFLPPEVVNFTTTCEAVVPLYKVYPVASEKSQFHAVLVAPPEVVVVSVNVICSSLEY